MPQCGPDPGPPLPAFGTGHDTLNPRPGSQLQDDRCPQFDRRWETRHRRGVDLRGRGARQHHGKCGGLEHRSSPRGHGCPQAQRTTLRRGPGIFCHPTPSNRVRASLRVLIPFDRSGPLPDPPILPQESPSSRTAFAEPPRSRRCSVRVCSYRTLRTGCGRQGSLRTLLESNAHSKASRGTKPPNVKGGLIHGRGRLAVEPGCFPPVKPDDRRRTIVDPQCQRPPASTEPLEGQFKPE